MKRVTSDGSEAVILLVDDNPGDVRLIRELVSDAEITNSIHAVTDGSDALDFVSQRGEFADAPRPDIVFLDWILPGKDGEQVLRELDEEGELDELFVVVLTGSPMDADSIVPSDLCVDGHLKKPIDVDELLSVIESSPNLSVTDVGA